MIEYVLYAIVLIILIIVIFIGVRAFNAGVDAKQNLKKFEKKIYIDAKNIKNVDNINDNKNLVKELRELKEMHENKFIDEEELKKAKDKILK